MADQGYQYDHVRDTFYMATGLNANQGGTLVGQLSVAESVDVLLAGAEIKVATTLYPFWAKGMVSFLNNLQVEKTWSGNWSQTSFALPPEGADTNVFYQPISGWVDSEDIASVLSGYLAKCDMDFQSADFAKIIREDIYSLPGDGTYLDDFIPVYFEGKYLKFWRPPKGSAGGNNIHLVYFKLPKYPNPTDPNTTYYSDLHVALEPMTVYFMLVDYYAIDGDSLDLAVMDARQGHLAANLKSLVGNLGFDPFGSEGKQ